MSVDHADRVGRGNRPHFEKLYAAAEEPWDYTARAVEVLRHEYIAERARRLEPRRVLDVGCSLGHVTARLMGLPARIDALDLVPAAVARARERLRRAAAEGRGSVPSLLVASALELPVRPASYDLVLCTDGLWSWQFDVERRAAVLAGIRDALEPGGHVLLTDYMRPESFPAFVADVEASPLRIVSVDYLHDRLWYQFESWFGAVRGSAPARALLGSIPLARALRAAARLIGPKASRHICILARREA